MVTLVFPLTIQGTDPSAANVILMCTDGWALTGKTVVINAVTIDGSGPGALTIDNTTPTVPIPFRAVSSRKES